MVLVVGSSTGEWGSEQPPPTPHRVACGSHAGRMGRVARPERWSVPPRAVAIAVPCRGLLEVGGFGKRTLHPGVVVVGSMMVVGTGMARVVGLGVLLATVGGPVSVMGSRRRSSNNNCNQGKGYCVQWTNHSRNPDSYRTPMNTWECLHGQMAIGLPDEIHTGMQDALGNPMAPTVRKEVEHLPDSQWADDNRESGRCRGCGCQCDVVRVPLHFERGVLASVQHM